LFRASGISLIKLNEVSSMDELITPESKLLIG
jgi:hypothetical protein